MNYDDYQRFEEIAFDHLLKKYGWKIHTTPRYALIDGVATKNGEITHIVEFKSRNESFESLERFETYLISYDKILNGIEMSRMMCVPFILIVYLIKDGIVLGIELGDEYGVCVPMEIQETRTQKSIDGAHAIRRNAFIDIEKFHIL